MDLKKEILEMPNNNYPSDFDQAFSTTCKPLTHFHSLLGQKFRSLGYSIAKHPKNYIIFPIFLSLISITGFQGMIYYRDTEYLYSPTNGHGWHERSIVEPLFPTNYSQFDPSRIIRYSAFIRLLVSAKDNHTMFRTKVWKRVMNVDRAIKNLTIKWDGDVYRYEHICAKWDSECMKNPILDLDEYMESIEDGSTFVNYPIMLFPLVVPFFYGGIEVNETEGVVLSVKSLSLTYWFKEGNSMEKQRSQIFEQTVLEYLGNATFEDIIIDRYASNSLLNEVDRNAKSVMKYFGPTIVMMILVTTLCMYSFDWVRSKMQIGLMGLVTVGLATGCSLGILMYCRVPFIGINLAAPFLVLGVGLDDMFVLVSAWNRSDIRSKVEERLAQTFNESAVSITITSVTNALAFLLGTMSPIPSVRIFCIYAGISILVTYFYFITLFGGCLTVAGYQEKQQRHAITNMVVKSKSEAENMGAWYSFWCAGGINKDDPYNPKDNKPPLMMNYFKEVFAKSLSYPLVKVLVFALFALYLAGAFYGCSRLKEGMENRNMVLADSYLNDYYDREDAMFRNFPYRIQVIINENISYSDPATKKKLLDLHSTLENLSYVGPSIYTESWIRRFYKYLERKPDLNAKITDESSFVKILKEKFLLPESAESLDVVFNDDETRILASRFIIQTIDLKTTTDDKNMMVAVRKIAEDSYFNVVVYHPLFPLFDQYLMVYKSTVQALSMVAAAMMIVSFIFIPNPLCVILVTFSVISILVGVMGYMSLWGVNLDGISMINLIMCIGFSVDFSAHIAYAYMTAKAESPKEKLDECLYKLGLPVVQSGITTITGVLVFILIPSYAFHTFFKIIFLVVIFGILHGTLLLPVVLSIFGPGSCKKPIPFL